MHMSYHVDPSTLPGKSCLRTCVSRAGSAAGVASGRTQPGFDLIRIPRPPSLIGFC